MHGFSPLKRHIPLAAKWTEDETNPPLNQPKAVDILACGAAAAQSEIGDN
jgi:hypothetical protein